MQLDSVNKWLSLASNVGVIAGFVLLAVQMHQNTEATRLQNAHDLWRELSSAEAAYIGESVHEALSVAMQRPADLSADQMSQVWGYINVGVYPSVSVWNAHEAGSASAADWVQAREAVISYINFPAGRVIWKLTNPGYPKAFVDAIDRELNARGDTSIDKMWRDMMRGMRELPTSMIDAQGPN